MQLTTNQHIYLARRLAKAHGLFVVSKPIGANKPNYLLYRELPHHRPALIGQRSSAAALLALVEKVTDCPASWPSSTNKTPTPTHMETAC
jgi:hypothetical protein